ncbi:MAG: hypothetical protein ACYC9X_14450 [Dehalococcoidia bacterium]
MGCTWLDLNRDAFTYAGLEPYVPAYVVADYLLVMRAEADWRAWKEQQSS